jgi:O-antigen ligase
LLEEESKKTAFSPPYIDWLPGAVDTSHSWDMLVWFFPAFVALLVVRHGFHRPRRVRMLFWGMVINASLLAIFGLIAPILVKHNPTWLTLILHPAQSQHQIHFFSTFCYSNNAGSFFILHFGLVCGLFFYYTRKKDEARAKLKSVILLIIIMLFFLAIHLTRCRFAILFSWMIALVFALYFLLVVSRKKSGRKRKTMITAVTCIGLSIIISFTLYMKTNKGLTSKLSAMLKPGKFIEEQFNLKFWQVEAAAKMWRDYPFFGVGGRGFREHLLQYVGDPKKRYFAKNYRGMAYVHNDFMQFLCEFGIVGTGLLMAVFFLLAAKIAVSKEKKEGFVLFGVLGLCGVLIHSLIDLPFRSPPVIIAFTVVLAGYSKLCQPQQHKREMANDTSSFTGFVTRFVNFYTILLVFVFILAWWALSPVRKNVSKDIVREVERTYEAALVSPRHDNVTPPKSRNASPALLRSLWWAKLLYSDYKKPHLLSARINFDLYRSTKEKNAKKAKGYLKEAFRSSLAARRFTNYGDIGFIKLHTAVLDALGYYLEESWCVLNLREFYPKDIRVNLLVREFYFRRPYLYRQ